MVRTMGRDGSADNIIFWSSSAIPAEPIQLKDSQAERVGSGAFPRNDWGVQRFRVRDIRYNFKHFTKKIEDICRDV